MRAAAGARWNNMSWHENCSDLLSFEKKHWGRAGEGEDNLAHRLENGFARFPKSGEIAFVQKWCSKLRQCPNALRVNVMKFDIQKRRCRSIEMFASRRNEQFLNGLKKTKKRTCGMKIWEHLLYTWRQR